MGLPTSPCPAPLSATMWRSFLGFPLGKHEYFRFCHSCWENGVRTIVWPYSIKETRKSAGMWMGTPSRVQLDLKAFLRSESKALLMSQEDRNRGESVSASCSNIACSPMRAASPVPLAEWNPFWEEFRILYLFQVELIWCVIKLVGFFFWKRSNI